MAIIDHNFTPEQQVFQRRLESMFIANERGRQSLRYKHNANSHACQNKQIGKLERLLLKTKICEHGNKCHNCCWPWMGPLNNQGYARSRITTPYGETVFVHRAVWMLEHKSSINKGMHVCHSCDNPPCCNPSHLWLGTHQENMKDMVSKGRHRRGNSKVINVPRKSTEMSQS